MGETGVWRRETIHSMLRRLPGWDYRARAIYQITIVLADRAGAGASGGAAGGAGSAGAGAYGAAGGFGSPSRATWFQLWAPGFQDTILFREGQLANMKRYLADIDALASAAAKVEDL